MPRGGRVSVVIPYNNLFSVSRKRKKRLDKVKNVDKPFMPYILTFTRISIHIVLNCPLLYNIH